ncbi:nuclear transport factor 2 family protein [Flexivirga alba]|uniref:Nuclear transport factor 2 family protein n=1 Tax=Flexivirga alba TaxID=702742 RepID=A0ABW2AEP1_9MICO
MNDTADVISTALDYFEGWYDANLARIEATLHPQLVKRSAMQANGQGPSVTTKERILELVREGGGTEDKTDDPIEVTVVDIHHDIAAAVVRSAQYREYLHLLRTPEGWRIVNAFWQLTDPEPEPPT